MSPEENGDVTIPWWKPGIDIFAKVSGWIVAPIVLSLFLGRWLDVRYNTKPWFFLGLSAIAFAITMFGIVKEAMIYIRQIEEEAKKAKDIPEIKK